MRHVLNRALDACHLPVAFYLAYAGCYTIAKGPGPLMAATPLWLTYAWAGALILGALLTTAGTLSASDRVEAAGHGFHLFGLGLYALTAYVVLGFSGSVVVVIFALGGVSASRLRVLRRSHHARRFATRHLGGGS